MFKRIDDILDSESIWKEFRKDIIINSSRAEALRYLRVNPRVKSRTPKMDEKREVGRLNEEVKVYMAKNSTRKRIRAIAYRLVASSFYFERSGPPREANDHVTVQGEHLCATASRDIQVHYFPQRLFEAHESIGTILCRFAKGSDNLRNLGIYLQNCQQQSFQPYFEIHEIADEGGSQRVEIGPDIIAGMTAFGYFDVNSIAIPISSKTGSISIDLHLTNEPTYVFPISGLPRNLADTAPLKRTSMHAHNSPPSPTLVC